MHTQSPQHTHTPSGRFENGPDPKPNVITPKRNNATMALYTLFFGGVVGLGAFTLQYFTQPDAAPARAPQQVAASAPQPVLPLAAPTPVLDAATQPETPTPSTLATLVDLSLNPQTVTRDTPIDLLSPVNPLASVLDGLQPDAGPALPPSTVAASLQTAVTAANTAQHEAAEEERALRLHMRMLKEGALAGVYRIEPLQKDGEQHVLYNPLNLEQSGLFVKTLLRKAEENGEITFPAGLSSENGDVDMDTMLFSLVQSALVRDGTPESSAAAAEMTRRAFAASGTTPVQLDGVTAYTVQPGDSLARISLKFYGQVGGFARIFEANRAVLSSPDRIRVGQRLMIPG